MQQVKMYRIPMFLFLQLLLSFAMVSFVVEQTDKHVPALSVALGCGLGLLLTANLFLSMMALQVVLDRLARGLPVELVALYRYWPLQTLFQLVHGLEQQRGQQVQVEQQTVAYKDQLMLQVIATTAQEERNRLARDLHDSIKQQIFSITMSAAAAKARWEHDLQRVRGILDDIERTSREAQMEMQAMLQQLRPRALENTGLIESLRMQSQALEYRTGAIVKVEIGQLPPEEQLSPGAQEVLFRVVQEGFANIARHARATHVWLSLYQQEQFLLLEIGDDGQGFNLAQMPDRSGAGGMGMHNIRERMQALHGKVQLWSMLAQGTTLQVAFPLLTQSEPLTDAEQPEPELTGTMKQAQKVLAAGFLMLELGAASLLLYAPRTFSLLTLILCLPGAGILWIVAYPIRMRVAISWGRKHHQHRYLRMQADKLLLGLLTLSLFLNSALSDYTWSLKELSEVLLVCLLLMGLRLMINDYTYRRSLSRAALQGFLHTQQQQLGLDFLAWSIVVAGEAFFGILTPDLLNTQLFSQAQWQQNAAIGLCLLWLLMNVVKGLALLYWQLALLWGKV